MDKYEPGMNKKSFSLYYHNGAIWCEHLDALYDGRELIIKKFSQDLITIARPSTSSFIAMNVDESVVDKELLDYLLKALNSIEKTVQKVAIIGLKPGMKRYARKFNGKFQIECIDDFEKAKEWLV